MRLIEIVLLGVLGLVAMLLVVRPLLRGVAGGAGGGVLALAGDCRRAAGHRRRRRP
ncbi:MAG: hypothetical protein R3F55_19800 [Alphaproteobacteria bacterium]